MHFRIKHLLITACIFNIGLLKSQSTSWTGITNTNWNTASNWTSGVPSSSIDVVIGDASFTGSYQPNLNVTSTCKSLTIGNSTKASTLTITRSITVYGNLLVGSNGTILANTGSRTIFCRGNFTNNGTYNATSSTAGVTLSGGISQTFTGVTTFRKFTVNSGSTLVLANNITINTSLSVSGKIEPSTYTINGTGTLTVNSNGVLKVYASTFAGNYGLSGTVTLNRTSMVDYAAISLAQTVSNSYTYGTLRISGGSTKSLTGNLPGLNSGSTTSGKIILDAGIFDLKTFTANRNSSGGGSITLASGTTLMIGGTNSFPSNYVTYAIASTSTVEYYGNAQTVSAITYGNLSLKASTGSVTKTMPATAMSIAGNFLMDIGTGTAVNATAAQNITFNGTVTIGASCTFSGASYTHTFMSNFTNNGTFTGSTSTVVFSGISSLISGSGTNNFNNTSFTAYGISASGSTSINVSGNLSTTTPGIFTHGSGGTVTMTGTSKTLSGNGLVLNNLTISNIASVTSTASFNLSGNFTNNGTYAASAGIMTMTGASTSIAGSVTPVFYGLTIEGTVGSAINFSLLSNVSIASTGSLTASAGTVTFNGTSTLNGTANLYNVTINSTKTLYLGSSSVLGIANTFTKTGTLDVTTYIPNTVNYNSSSAQSVISATYNNLILSGGNTKTPSGAITVNNDFTISSGVTFNGSSYIFSLYRHWNNLGTFTASTSDVQLRGSNSATLTGATTFNNFTVNKTLNTIKVILANNVIASNIVMTSGTINTGSNSITTTSGRTGNGIIIGTITHNHSFSNATAYSFEGPNNLLTFSSPSGVNSVTVTTIIGEILDFDPSLESIIREYQVTIGSGTYSSASMRIHYENNELNAFAEPFLSFYKFNSGTTWDSLGYTSRDTAANYVELVGITNVAGRFSASGIRNVVRWNGSVSNNWNTAANWTTISGSNMSNRVPNSTDAAQIGFGSFTNNPTLSNAVSVNVLRFGSVQAATLTISGGSLNVVGSTRGQWSTNRSHNLIVSSGSLTTGTNVKLSDGTSGRDIQLQIGSGTVTVNGDLTMNGSSSVAFTGSGNLILLGSFTNTSGNFTPGTGTITYSGGEIQNVANVNYYNLSFTKSTARATIIDATTVSGNLNMTTGGEVIVQDSLTVIGNLTIGASTYFETENVVVSVGGNFSKVGTFIPNNGTVIFNGTGAQTLNSGTFNTINIYKSSGTLTLIGDVFLNGNLEINTGTLDIDTFHIDRNFDGGIFSMAASSNLLIAGSNHFPAKFISNVLNASSIVTYDGIITQSIKNLSYGNLVFSNGGSNVKSFLGNVIVNQNITINSNTTVAPDIYTITLFGNFTNSGTFNAGTGNVNFNGVAKTITGTTTFNNISFIDGSYTVSSGTTTITGDLYIESTGSLNLGNNTTILDGDLTNKGTLTSNGISTFSGTRVQTLRLINAISSSSTGVVNFNGTVAPIINSSSPPNFATVNINNTGGISPTVPWTVYFNFNVAAGATFNGGPLTHTFYGNFTNNGIVNSEGVLRFSPGAPYTSSAAIKLDGVSFTSTGEVSFAGTAPITITQVAPVLNVVSVTNTNAAGVTAPASWTIADELRIGLGATFKAGTGTSHLISGSMINNGTLDGQTSTIRFDGSPSELNGDGVSNFYNLKIESTADFALSCDINILHNLIVDNNFITDGATISFTGSLASVISGAISPVLLEDVAINKSGNTTTLNVPVTITGDLTLTLGNLYTSSTNILNIADDANTSSGSSLSFVNGPMRKTGNDAFEFPLGKGSNWARLGISAPTNVTDAFTAEYFNTAYTNITSMATTPSPVLSDVSMQEYWICDRTTGTSNVTVQLFWETTLSGINNYSSDLVVARWNGSAWENKGQSAITASTPGSVTSNSITNFSPFTFGSLSPFVNPLPVSLISFEGQLNPNNTIDLKWKTAYETDNSYFTIEKSRDGKVFVELTKVNGSGTTNTIHNYSCIDQNPFAGHNYFRLKQTDINGNTTYSKIIVILFNEQSTNKFEVFPNPSNGIFNVALGDRETGKLILLNSNGLVIEEFETGKEVIQIDLSLYPQGLYHLRLETATRNETIGLLKSN